MIRVADEQKNMPKPAIAHLVPDAEANTSTR
jgi:hypothetical protein